jgi:glycosyltransferase involved in cell wall biosynthesis
MLKIIIDGSPLSRPMTGIGSYTNNLVMFISDYFSDSEIIILSPYPISTFDYKDNVRVIATSLPYFPMFRLMWFQLIFPLTVLLMRPSYVLLSDGISPLFLKEKNLITILYDFVPQKYGETMSFFARYYRRLGMKLAFKKSDYLLPISKSVMKESEELNILSSKKYVMYPCLDAEILVPEPFGQRQIKSGEEDYLLILSTNEPRKNLLNLLTAFQNIYLKGLWPPKLIIKMVGHSGWKSQDVSQLADALSNAGILKRLGFISNKDRTIVIRNAKALCFPSVYEGFGLPVAEAIMLSTPVICSDIPVLREVCDGQPAIFHGTESYEIECVYLKIFAKQTMLERPNPSIIESLLSKAAKVKVLQQIFTEYE